MENIKVKIWDAEPSELLLKIKEMLEKQKINVKDREAEAERYWKRLIEKHVKHDLSKVDLKTAEIYKQSIILLNILKNNETGAVIAALAPGNGITVIPS